MGMYRLTKKEAKEMFEKGLNVQICNKRNYYFPNAKVINKKYGTFEEQVEKFKEKYNIERPSFWA